MSKKSHSSKKSSKLNLDKNSIVKVLNFSNFARVYRKEVKKDKMKDSGREVKLKKKNINELMKEQRKMLKSLGSGLKISLA
jgi:hypothetical protein